MTMSGASLIFLSIRSLHVLLAALWLGATGFAVLFLDGLLADTGSDGSAAILTVLDRRKFHAFMGSVGGLVVLSGAWLYWRFTGHFDPNLSGTMGARVFGAGGASGIIALIVGGSVIGRNMKKVTGLAARGAVLPDGPERTSIFSQVQATRRRIHSAGWITFVLQMIALVLMAIGHYV